MIAAYGNQDMIISLLVKSGAKIDIRDAEGKTALVIAQENNAEKSIEMLKVVSAN
jgi:ankyrin repeat protein